MTRSTSSSPLSRRRALSAALLASVAIGTGWLLAGCSAGQITQTNTQVAAVPGVSVDSPDGKISLRDGLIVYANSYKSGSVVPMQLRLFNRGAQATRLTAATSDRGQVVLVGTATPSPTATTPSPAASATASPSASGSPRTSNGASASPSNGASAGPSAATSPTPPGSATINIEIPAGGYVLLTPENGTYLAITNLRGEDLRAGESIEDLTLTFTHADGTSTTLGPIEVPMAVPLTPLPRPSGAGEEH